MTNHALDRSGEPLHRQLRRIMLDQMAGGVWKPNSRVASERQLCALYSVSRTTTRRVVADLVHEGHLYTVAGKGIFVAERPLRQELKPLVGFREDLRSQGVVLTTRVLEAERVEAIGDLAERLGVRSFLPVHQLKRLRLGADQPLAIQTSYIPEHLCPGLLRFDLAANSLFELLREEYGLALTSGSTRIKSGLALAEECSLLDLPSPSAVLRTFQTTYLADGTVAEYCVSAFAGECFELTSTSGADHLVRVT